MQKQELVDLCREILERAGASKEDASVTAEVLVLTDMRGVHSHGVMRLKRTVECLQAGGFRSGTEPVIEHETACTACMDARGGMGIPASVKATDLAIRKAGEAGIAIVCVRNSHHNGASGIYTMMCADSGLIGMAMTTVPPIMAVTGSRANSIGNNPFSCAVPAGRYRAVMLDIAMSAVASGKLVVMAEEQKSIPYGWLLDSKGRDTHDPSEHLKEGSTLLPFAGHKGYGLAVMVEALAGVLTGAAVLGGNPWNNNPGAAGDTGHTFIAVDPALVNPGVDFTGDAEKMVETLINSPKAEGVQRIYYPGEIEIENEKAARENGILLPAASLLSMRDAAGMTGISLPPYI